MPEKGVVVVGGAGAQAQAMLLAAERAGVIEDWTAIDRDWGSEARRACEERGIDTVELDLLEDPDRLCDLISGAALVANFAGPFFRTGTAVLDACIEVRCDYLDICDDADATVAMLARHQETAAAEIRALVGMGSAPGVTNVLVRTAADALGTADEVSISWVVDVSDVGAAALRHLWHIFAPVGPDGAHQPVPGWEQLNLRTASFPPPLGENTVIALAHPEPITIPRFLGIETVRSYGSVVPADALVMNWALARAGAGGDDAGLANGASGATVPSLASGLYRNYMATREPTEYLGGGLVVDVWSGEEGIRFASADNLGMAESTGVPAAAGIALLLEGGPKDHGVMAPECLDPAEFFPALGRCSRGTGSLGAYRLRGSEQGERIRIRDLLSTVSR